MIKDSTINSFKIFTKVGCRIIKVFELGQQDRSCSQCRRETIIAQEGGALFFSKSHMLHGYHRITLKKFGKGMFHTFAQFCLL